LRLRLRDYGQFRQLGRVPGFFHDRLNLFEDLGHAHGVHLTTVIVSALGGLLQIAARHLGGKPIGNDVAGTFFLHYPGVRRHSNPDRPAIHRKADVDRIGVSGRDGDDIGCPPAVQILPGPAIDDVKIFVHRNSVEHFWPAWGRSGIGTAKEIRKKIKKKENFTGNLRPIRRN